MARHPLFQQVLRLARLAGTADRHGLETEQAIALAQREHDAARDWSRRQVLGIGASAALASTLGARALAAAPKVKPGFGGKIAILGGGLAGLTAADRLATAGIAATIYEASGRLGGRQHSDRTTFPGQAAEIGGELIDNLHKTMLGYANAFGLALEDLGKVPGEETYYFAGKHWGSAQIVDEMRVFTARAGVDFKASSGGPTAFSYNAADVKLDHETLESFLNRHTTDMPLVRAVLSEAYEAEYGRATSDQSALNLLLFVHFDRRSKFTPYGVFSDERYHVVNGNDLIAQGIAAKLPGPAVFGARITGLDRGTDGRYRITIQGQKQPALADAVICTLPFSVLRAQVKLGAGLKLSPEKLYAIQAVGYGTNTKTMIGFDGRPWLSHASKGTVYSDLPELQAAWETNPTKGGATSILTDYASAARGEAIGGRPLQSAVSAFLSDLDKVWPGAAAAAHRDGGQVRAVRAAWPVNPNSLGSYTCYKPGQFTTISGHEGTAAGQLKFAGEHADLFANAQGFMEGACASGIRAAVEVLADIKAGKIV